MILEPSQVANLNPLKVKVVPGVLHMCARVVNPHLVPQVFPGENSVPPEGGGGVEVY